MSHDTDRLAVRIVLADDHALVRRSVAALLRTLPEFDVVADVSTTDAAVAACQSHQPDVLLLDVDIPGIESFEAARRACAASPSTKVLFLSAFTHDRYIEAALEAGAMGYVTKSEPPEQLVGAIRAVVSGDCYFSPDVRRRLVVDEHGASLSFEVKSRSSTMTPREVEVLRYIARGLSKKQIASLMKLSVKTIENHTANLMSRLGIHDRVELTRFAIREGLVEP
jgi:DNA-binding NarL/FixJ family response regulator